MRINVRNIDKQVRKLEEKRKNLEETQLNALRELLPNDVIETICHECEYDFRNRFITPLITIFHMIGAAISRECSFQSAWHNTGETGNSDVLAKARKRLTHRVWENIFKWINSSIEEAFSEENTWFGHRIVGIDGMCSSMSDEQELEKAFGKPGSKHGKGRFPVVRTVVAFSLNTFHVVGYESGAYTKGENKLFASLMSRLKKGDLIIGDRRYAGAKLYIDYKLAGLEFITRAHQRLKIEQLKVLKKLGNNDLLVKLPIQPIYQKADPSLPKAIVVRIMKTKVTVRGKKEAFWLATSLLDPKKYSANEIKLLYKKRWKIETLIKELKIWLGADILRSKSVKGIYKELSARTIAFNLIRWLMLKAAKKHSQKADCLSTSATLRLTACYGLKMSTAPLWRLMPLYEELLDAIASSQVPYRPNRIEPRLKKRDQKHYPILKISRIEWRAMNEIAA